jgi:hypothetical protein
MVAPHGRERRTLLFTRFDRARWPVGTTAQGWWIAAIATAATGSGAEAARHDQQVRGGHARQIELPAELSGRGTEGKET